jgi:hypothetical protein
MATVVAITDRPGWAARTDNIVIVDPSAEQLLWVPRDLWCASIQDRVNTAFARAGHRGLTDALAEHGFIVQHSLCLCRDAVEHALEDVEVTVPVDQEQVYWYPLAPQKPIKDGRKIIRFCPPAETLRGERLHQWIGARYGFGWSSTDFDRIRRQQTLLECLWDEGFDFGRAVEHSDWGRPRARRRTTTCGGPGHHGGSTPSTLWNRGRSRERRCWSTFSACPVRAASCGGSPGGGVRCSNERGRPDAPARSTRPATSW